MPDKTISCPRCKKSGFIRIEHIIQAGRTVHSYFCGACTYRWEISEKETSKPPKEGNKSNRPRDG
jgi:transposase-like protein